MSERPLWFQSYLREPTLHELDLGRLGVAAEVEVQRNADLETPELRQRYSQLHRNMANYLRDFLRGDAQWIDYNKWEFLDIFAALSESERCEFPAEFILQQEQMVYGIFFEELANYDIEAIAHLCLPLRIHLFLVGYLGINTLSELRQRMAQPEVLRQDFQKAAALFNLLPADFEDFEQRFSAWQTLV